MNYKDALTQAMGELSRHPKTLFLGQSVAYKGTAMFDTLADVPMSRRVELPVAEEMQLGMCIGLSLSGYIPVCLYPRWNFLLLAINQLVNHLDKLESMGGYQPKVIIRTSVGSVSPLNPQIQHVGNFHPQVAAMLTNIQCHECWNPEQVLEYYHDAIYNPRGKSVLITEFADYYNYESNPTNPRRE